jgi:hypothetical protein
MLLVAVVVVVSLALFKEAEEALKESVVVEEMSTTEGLLDLAVLDRPLGVARGQQETVHIPLQLVVMER